MKDSRFCCTLFDACGFFWWPFWGQWHNWSALRSGCDTIVQVPITRFCLSFCGTGWEKAVCLLKCDEGHAADVIYDDYMAIWHPKLDSLRSEVGMLASIGRRMRMPSSPGKPRGSLKMCRNGDDLGDSDVWDGWDDCKFLQIYYLHSLERRWIRFCTLHDVPCQDPTPVALWRGWIFWQQILWDFQQRGWAFLPLSGTVDWTRMLQTLQ